MSRYPEDGDEVVWADGHEGSIWISDGEVYFILDKENYEASMTPDEALAFAAALIKAAQRAQARPRLERSPQKKWDAWADKDTGEAMLSRVDGDHVYVRPVHTIHEPAYMTKAEFETRFGASARKEKK